MTELDTRNRGGRPPIPEPHRRKHRLHARITVDEAAAAQQVADAEGRSLASLVRVSLHAYCRPRLAARRDR